MVEHAPTGTPIDDPELIRVARRVPLGKVCQYHHNDIISGMVVMELGGEIASKHPISLSYRGVLDDEYSVYTGLWLGNTVIIVVNKCINPDTHDVSVDWDEDDQDCPDIFIMGRAIVVIKPKEVMKW